MNHEKLYHKIREAQPEKDFNKYGYGCFSEDVIGQIEITLADVMLALNHYYYKTGNLKYNYLIDMNGAFFHCVSVNKLNYSGHSWDFTKNLSGQSDELKDWLSSILLGG